MPGSSGDNVIRMITPRISGPLGQQVIVDNRPSATTAETLVKSPPDGYTLLIDATSLWMGPQSSVRRCHIHHPLLC